MPMSANVFPRRVLAFALDSVLLFVALIPLGQVVQRLLGVRPETPLELWCVVLLNMSLPTWLYFTLADASRGGATLGKRCLGLRVEPREGGRVPLPRALARTAVKLLPWELVHLTAFALAPAFGEFGGAQMAGLALANLLMLAYLGVAVVTAGERAPHDFAAGTRVHRAGAVPRP